MDIVFDHGTTNYVFVVAAFSSNVFLNCHVLILGTYVATFVIGGLSQDTMPKSFTHAHMQHAQKIHRKVRLLDHKNGHTIYSA